MWRRVSLAQSALSSGRSRPYAKIIALEMLPGQAMRLRRVASGSLLAVEEPLSLGAALKPSSSSAQTAAERLMPFCFAKALTDAKRWAGRRTVTSGSPPSLVRFCLGALID